MDRIILYQFSQEESHLFFTLKDLFGVDVVAISTLEKAEKELNEEGIAAFVWKEGDDENEKKLQQTLSQVEKTFPLVLFTPHFDQIDTFVQAKEKGMDYVLPWPPTKEVVSALFRQLFQPKSAPLTVPEELLTRYRESVIDKIKTLNDSFYRFAEEGGKQELFEAKKEIHKLSGSAAPYGFPEAGRWCKEEDISLSRWIDIRVPSNHRKEIAEELFTFLRQLKLAFQNITLTESVIVQEIPVFPVKNVQEKTAEKKHTVVLLSEDMALIQHFQQVAKEKRVSLLIETDIKMGIQAIKEGEGVYVIIDDFFPLANVSGMDVVKTVRKNAQERFVSIGYLTIEENFLGKLDGLKQGIHFFFHKPLSTTNIEDGLERLISQEQEEKFRVLIVDDDPEISLLVKKYLEELGIEVRYVSDETSILKELEDFSPHILLLDLTFPEHDGWELFDVIRSDMRFDQLAILIFTVDSRPETLEKAYEEGCDGFILKSYTKSHIQKRVLAIAERFRSLGILNQKEILTGLSRPARFSQFLHHFLINREPEGDVAGVLLIEIFSHESLEQTFGRGKFRDLILLASQILQEVCKEAIQGFYDGEGKFGFFFEEIHGGKLEYLFNAFLHKLRNEGTSIFSFKDRIMWWGGAVLFSPQEYDEKKILFTANQALQEAKESGEERCMIRRLYPIEKDFGAETTVIIIDDDENLTNILIDMYQKIGLSTIVFHSGIEGIRYFSGKQQLNPKTLLILDRILPDMDGIQILRAIRQKFPKGYKVIFLSSLSQEKDVLAGLQEGAVDYLTKPFSTEILLQKSLDLLRG